jgi:ornithine lipid hydroxylase
LSKAASAAVRYLIYPAVITSAVAAAWLLYSRGVPATAALLGVNGVAFLLAALAERFLPYYPEWRASRGDVTTDLLGLALSVTLAGGAAQGAALALAAPLSAWLAGEGGLSWPSAWPLWAQLPLALVALEFGNYWVHRIQHEGGWLWRLHAPHHSVRRMYWLNGNRNHPGDVFLTTFLMLLPLALLGAREGLLLLVGVVGGVHLTLQHSNIDYRLGPLNWIVSAGEVHRWHHSRVLGEANANYGAVLLVWDLVFGTRRVPRDRRPPRDVGLAGDAKLPEGYWGQLRAPFRGELWRS